MDNNFVYDNFSERDQRAYLEAQLTQLEAKRFNASFELDSLTSRIKEVREQMSDLPQLTEEEKKQLNSRIRTQR